MTTNKAGMESGAVSVECGEGLGGLGGSNRATVKTGFNILRQQAKDRLHCSDSTGVKFLLSDLKMVGIIYLINVLESF